jgi:hypothetical protein
MKNFSWKPDHTKIHKENKFGLSQNALLLKDQSLTKKSEFVEREFTRQMNHKARFVLDNQSNFVIRPKFRGKWA